MTFQLQWEECSAWAERQWGPENLLHLVICSIFWRSLEGTIIVISKTEYFTNQCLKCANLEASQILFSLPVDTGRVYCVSPFHTYQVAFSFVTRPAATCWTTDGSCLEEQRTSERSACAASSAATHSKRKDYAAETKFTDRSTLKQKIDLVE